MRMLIAGKVKKISDQKGFTFLFLLMLLAILAVTSLSEVALQSTVTRREKEKELIYRGERYVSAIGEYYAVSHTYPTSLDQLLDDGRFSNRHYLREKYKDPFGGDFVPIMGVGGTIIGVRSSSDLLPFKTNLMKVTPASETAQKYSDWRFEYSPSTTPKPAVGGGV